MKRYNLFIFLSMFSRTMLDFYMLIKVYEKVGELKKVFIFLMFTYIFGFVSNRICKKIIEEYNYKVGLVISCIMYGLSFIYLESKFNLIMLSFIYSMGNYMYHFIRHYLAMNVRIKNMGIMIIFNYLGVIMSTYLSFYFIKKRIVSIIIYFIIFIIAIMVGEKIEVDEKVKVEKIEGRKKLFFILEQSKVIIYEVMSLFLFIYKKTRVKGIAGVNIFICIGSIIFLIFINGKKSIKTFKMCNIILCMMLIIKIINNKRIVMYIVSIVEGIVLKGYDYFSLINLYNCKGNKLEYLYRVENLLFITKIIMIGVCMLLNSFSTSMYVLIILMICLTFIYDASLLKE